MTVEPREYPTRVMGRLPRTREPRRSPRTLPVRWARFFAVTQGLSAKLVREPLSCGGRVGGVLTYEFGYFGPHRGRECSPEGSEHGVFDYLAPEELHCLRLHEGHQRCREVLQRLHFLQSKISRVMWELTVGIPIVMRTYRHRGTQPKAQ